jgi:hypothetical protein
LDSWAAEVGFMTGSVEIDSKSLIAPLLQSTFDHWRDFTASIKMQHIVETSVLWQHMADRSANRCLDCRLSMPTVPKRRQLLNHIAIFTACFHYL